MISLIENHYPALIGIVIALAIIIWPTHSAARDEAARRKRLTELNNDAPEGFFEQRAELPTHRVNAAPYRYAGLLLLIFSLANLLL